MEEERSQDNSSFLSITGKTIEKNGIVYAKDSDTGQIYNVTKGYNVGNVMNAMELKSLNSEIEESDLI